ncbi:ketopantoate reductase PanE/ApbA C terminal-domain-containing protein [Chaetomidium leptoderma]|uniref:2-dehydropantoate 2-reductase n=1 Tax=Chaetomidium leptoderma TaxID=669021 RepID=A0AAN6VVQ2_9PEZI|nr:ketopantoate reductase PanE/ApbA C terminal-domain-containing protein [Chaetomidium leptoderma]
MDKGIHVLGLGNLGKYVAYALMRRRAHFPPVTLMFHRTSLLADWKNADRSIRCTDKTHQGNLATEETRVEGFRVELLDDAAAAGNKELGAHQPDVTIGSKSPIKHLIVATKTYATTAALTPIKDRLSKDSNVLFLQNGMGVTDEVSDALFPDPETRPTYWAGVCHAGVYSTSPFSIVHAGRGPLMVGAVGNRSRKPQDAPPLGSTNALLAQLSMAEMLETNILSGAIMQPQLTKLVINSIINPLTAIFNCKNGQVFESREAKDLFHHLLEEAGAIVRALLPELEEAFSDESLGSLVQHVAKQTAKNTSSMLQDVQAGRRTEIDYINGYLISQGKRLGLPHKRHAAVYGMIKQLEVENRECPIRGA